MLMVDSARTKRVKAKPPKLARRTMTLNVSSPTVAGAVDLVEVVIDTVAAMRKRRQLDAQQWLAVETYRSAYDRVGSRLGGSMDFDRVRGVGSTGYSEIELVASGTLREASRILGQVDGRVIELVVGNNWTIEQTARLVCGHLDTQVPTKHECVEMGLRLRRGLTALADHWHPTRRSAGHMTSQRSEIPLTSRSGIREIPLGAYVDGKK